MDFTAIPGRTGRRIIGFWRDVLHFRDFLRSIITSFQSLRYIRLRSLYTIVVNQTIFTGIDALLFVVLIALMIGATVIIQASTNLPRFGIEGFLGNILVIIIARELGPLVTALIVISRSGSAMVAEIAVQKWSREILSMEIMGIDTRLYIVIPRVIASILSITSLIVIFDAVAFFGGYLISLTTIYIPVDQFIQALLDAFSLKDLVSALIKSITYGTLIPIIACYYGFQPRSKFEVPVYVSRGVIRTLFLIFVINALISVIFYF
jgi:phospholipid/cholesterol/gamma-HCH transport system permease protein